MQVWPGLGRRGANPSRKPDFPVAHWATRNPPASPPAVSSVFMTSAAQTRMRRSIANANPTRHLSRPDEGAIGPNPRNPMHLPRGIQVSVIPGNRC